MQFWRGDRRRWMIVGGLIGLLVAIGMFLLVGVRARDEVPGAPAPDAGAPRVPDASEPADSLVFDADMVRSPADTGARPARRRITSREVRRLHQRYGGQLKYCYDKVARRAGILVQRKSQVTVRLAPGGKVKAVVVRAGGDRELESCLRRFIARWRFSSTLGEQDVEFPIVFAR